MKIRILKNNEHRNVIQKKIHFELRKENTENKLVDKNEER